MVQGGACFNHTSHRIYCEQAKAVRITSFQYRVRDRSVVAVVTIDGTDFYHFSTGSLLFTNTYHILLRIDNIGCIVINVGNDYVNGNASATIWGSLITCFSYQVVRGA